MTLRSPVGTLAVVLSEQGVRALLWEADLAEAECATAFDGLAEGEGRWGKRLRQELSEYFEGRRRVFEVPVDAVGTAFQQAAWGALREIPYGEVRAYSEQAERLGDRRKSRAVGGANARNPVSIVVPCHRVIGKSGALTGFAGGTEAKRFLLALEGAL